MNPLPKLCCAFVGILGFLFSLFASAQTTHVPVSPPVPIELMLGNNRLFFQSLISKPFAPGSRFGLFTIAVFQAGYNNDPNETELAIPVQASYRFWKGFGAFAGMAMNNKSGMHPVVGPQFVSAKPTYLIVVNGRYLLTADHNYEVFALVEYKPKLNARWSLYSRAQGLYSYNSDSEFHDRSFFYLRLGLQRNAFSFGPGANLDVYGPDKTLKENYGVYFRWEFR